MTVEIGSMIRVLIVDDHPIVRKGVRAELSGLPDIQVVGEAASGDEALVKTRADNPDIVLLDISLPGRSGLEILRHIKSEMPRVRILVLSAYPEKQYAIRSLKSGALGYLTKENSPEELIAAIRKVAEGRKYVSANLAELLAAEINESKEFLPHERLTNREYEILCLLGKGKTLSEIAEVLSISLSTVSTHRGHITSKMGLQSTAQIIHYALEHGLIEKHDL